jgi:riboflavin transporter FmnP
MSTGVAVATSLSSVFFCVFNYTLIMFAFGVLATFTEWDNINAPTSHKIGYMFTFPAFMLTYIPIALVALVKKAEWKPIAHTISVDVESLSRGEEKAAA